MTARAELSPIAAVLLLSFPANAQDINPSARAAIAKAIDRAGYYCARLLDVSINGPDEYGMQFQALCAGDLKFRVSVNPNTERVTVRPGW